MRVCVYVERESRCGVCCSSERESFYSSRSGFILELLVGALFYLEKPVGRERRKRRKRRVLQLSIAGRKAKPLIRRKHSRTSHFRVWEVVKGAGRSLRGYHRYGVEAAPCALLRRVRHSLHFVYIFFVSFFPPIPSVISTLAHLAVQIRDDGGERGRAHSARREECSVFLK